MRTLEFNTALGDSPIFMVQLKGHEGLSQLFEYQLQLVTQQPLPEANTLIGKDVSFAIMQQSQVLRQFNGILTSLCKAPDPSRMQWYCYRATVRPWLWLLTHNIDCRIFPNCSSTLRKKVKLVAILQELLDHYKPYKTDYSHISGNYPEREFCVQYNETDYNFLTRLLEEHGIFYLFSQTKTEHGLILGDEASAYGKNTITPYTLGVPNSNDPQIFDWLHYYNYIPQGHSVNSHDYQNPTLKLLAQSDSTVQLATRCAQQKHRYPARHLTRNDGTLYASRAISSEETQYSIVNAASNIANMAAGDKVSLRPGTLGQEQQREFIITTLDFQVDDNNLPGMVVATPQYRNDFTAIPSNQLFRPQRLAVKPHSYELHEAVITGAKGEELHTDPNGCHRIQFCWDTYSQADANASCWVRYAAQNEGMLRVGTPVLVSFLQGDIDQPIILAPLYDAQQKPLFTEPTMSGIKRRPGLNSDGSYYNELRFNDKKDNGQVYLNVYNDMKCDIGHDLMTEVKKGNDTLIIDEGNLIITVKKGEYQLTVKGNITIKTDGDLGLTAKNINLTASGQINASGKNINLNQ